MSRNRNQKGFTDDEKQESRIAIYQNIMESIVSLLDAMQGELEQGGEGEVVGQLSCIYETITTKILKKLKKFFI